MTTLLVIRPGTTDYDDQGRIKGCLDIPLNRHGADQTAQTVRETSHLPIKYIYAAPCRAAAQTGEALAEACGAKIKQTPRLRNLDPGLWQGKLIEEVKQQHPKIYRRWQEQPDTVCPPEGEMLVDARQRLQAMLDTAMKKHRNGVVAMIVPEPLATVLCTQLKGEQLGNLWAAERADARWELFELQPAGLAAGTNETSQTRSS